MKFSLQTFWSCLGLFLLGFLTRLSFQSGDGLVMEYRIINRQPHRLTAAPVRDQTLTRSPCEAAACPMDDTYPTDLVTSIVTQHSEQMERFYSLLYSHPAEELILMENSTDSYRLKGNFACESDVVWLKLGWARDLKGRQLVIINTARFPQIHRVESCRYADKRCEYLPPCYKSRCQQRYTHRHLIALDPGKLGSGPFVELFPLPSSCSCFVENFTYF